VRTLEKAKTCALRAREWRYNSKTVERVGRVYIIMFVSSCQLHEHQNSRTLERDIRGHLKSHSRTLDLVWIPRYIGISTYKYKLCYHSAACLRENLNHSPRNVECKVDTPKVSEVGDHSIARSFRVTCYI
jgi:hypothetical protein